MRGSTVNCKQWLFAFLNHVRSSIELIKSTNGTETRTLWHVFTADLHNKCVALHGLAFLNSLPFPLVITLEHVFKMKLLCYRNELTDQGLWDETEYWESCIYIYYQIPISRWSVRAMVRVWHFYWSMVGDWWSVVLCFVLCWAKAVSYKDFIISSTVTFRMI